MANKLRAQVDEQKIKIEELNLKIQNLTASIEQEKLQNQTTIQTKDLVYKEKETAKLAEHESNVKELNTKIDTLASDLKEKQVQLDRKELKKLAEAFAQEEISCELNQKKWLTYLMCVMGVLVVYAIISIYLTTGKVWFDRLGYYVIDLILVSAVWFCSSQFTEATRLMHDYGNRKTLAQSFNNILNNLPEDEDIRTKFIEKSTDVLCAPAGFSDKEPVLTKKLLKDTAEILGSAVKK